MRDKTAAILVIGNEILSGKVVDTNAAFLAQELRALGVDVARILIIPDEVDTIAAAVRSYHPSFDIVFTSGGVGPTHDDVTIEGIARGLDRPVVRHPQLEALLHEHIPGDLTEAHLKMAQVPQGAELISAGRRSFPTVCVENIFIFPGIPELLRDKFNAVKERFLVDPYHLRVLYLRAVESSLAPYLDATLAGFPDLLLGSYPKLGHSDYSVRVTLESKDREYLQRAFADLIARLPDEMVVRAE